ncbi:NAD(P)-binding protein [Kocuria marina]|uniref:NAD(P)-binding protein n=1 Tax=Kocuria marina TaxID=223184 RepID=UPI003460EEE6
MSQRIAIIGAGIGGLTLAIDLQRKGLDVRIYEQTAVLREVDAAVPHHGQGANQSIEDAIVLSDLLSSTTDWDHARAEYERRRRFRTRKIVDASVTVGEMLHLPDGARARERNARLAAPDAFDRHLDWIHSFRADEQVPDAPAVGG